MRVGTSHFVNRVLAYRYFSAQNETKLSVDTKIRDGEIRIGKPTLKDGERLVIVDNGCRYAIETL